MRIDELRSTLEDHAEEIGSGDAIGRVGAVHSRVATVRRRRRTAVAAAAVVALAAGAAGIVPVLDGRPPAPAKAPDELAGMTVPQAETAVGWTYRYVRGVESEPGADALRLDLDRTGEPYLVMWASSDRDPDLRLRDRTTDLDERSLTPGFERYTYFPGDSEQRLVLRGTDAPDDARLAMAVFERVEEPPPGVSNGEVTYRERVADQPLLGARISEPGENEIAFDITAPDGRVGFFPTCFGGSSARQMVYMRVDGRPAGGVGCGDTPDVDPAAGGSSFPVRLAGVRPGETVRVTAYLGALGEDRRVQDPEAVIGLGVYAESPRARTVAGWELPPVLESDGHEWTVDTVGVSEVGEREISLQLRASDVPRMVTTMFTGTGRGIFTARLLADGEISEDRSMNVGEPAMMQSGYVVQPGESPRLTYRVTGDRLGRSQVGIAVSELYH